MASKLAVAGVIEGNLTDEGLAAMSEVQEKNIYKLYLF